MEGIIEHVKYVKLVDTRVLGLECIKCFGLLLQYLMNFMERGNRDYSMDLLKAIAAILITNSHMESMYTSCSWLATGGAIGDSLFFFCSGYTLMLSNRDNGFFNWYKRRINRVFHTILTIGLIFAIENIILKKETDLLVNLNGGWFISCILLYYIVFYPIKRYCIDKLWAVVFLILFLCMLIYYLTPLGNDGVTIYHETYFKWFHFFISMIVGALCCRYKIKNRKKQGNSLLLFIVLLLVIGIFYAILFVSTSYDIRPLQLIDIIVLPIVNVALWMFCNSKALASILPNKVFKACFMTIGGLCLEIYLVQYNIFTTKLNDIFPLNLIVIFLVIVIAAYLVRCFSRVIAQTFKDSDYDWKEIVRIY